MTTYPKTFELKDGTSVIIRPLVENDFEKSFKFFCSLSENDRLFLKCDVTDRDAVSRRMNPDSWDTEYCYRLVAEKDNEIIADSTICQPKYGWTSHTATLRYIVAKEYRSKGLANIIVRELFVEAVKQGVEKIEAEVMEENVAGIKCVEKLGFIQEGVLEDFATDVKGKRHNLVIMSYFV
jgi:[ribosomal protein S5]-alanine N-acetyltransferase